MSRAQLDIVADAGEIIGVVPLHTSRIEVRARQDGQGAKTIAIVRIGSDGRASVVKIPRALFDAFASHLRDAVARLDAGTISPTAPRRVAERTSPRFTRQPSGAKRTAP